jgi:hypothetical protein
MKSSKNKQCVICGKIFRVKSYRIEKARFCSRQCAGQSLTGANNPFFGKHHTKEAIRKNAEAHKGKIPWNKGLSADTDNRVAESVESMVAINKKRSPEHNAKLGACHAGIPSWNKGITPSQKTRQKLSESIKDKIENDAEYRQQVLLALEKARKEIHRKPNIQEQQLIQLIEQGKFPFKYTGDGSFVIGGYIPDFVNTDGKKQTIELFGDYWHNRDNIPWHQTELGRMMAYSQFGYKTLVIWERELKEPAVVISRIKSFMREGKRPYKAGNP